LTCVDLLYFLERHVVLSTFLQKGLVITWSLLSMGDIVRISKQNASANRVKEPNSLVSACRYNELSFSQVTDVNDRSIMSTEPLEDRYVPRGVSLKELNHVLL
jgi:hypothetical protein